MRFSVVIPCYNEASRGRDTDVSLENRLEKLHESFRYFSHDVEFLFILDGCKDNTGSVITKYKKENNIDNWHIYGYDKNHGKGYAIKYGIQFSRYEYIIFMDADLSVSLDTIEFDIAFLNSFDYIIYSRYTQGSIIKNERPALRNILSILARLILRENVQTGIKDTQCGMKIFEKSTIIDYLPFMCCNRWLFDIELLYIFKLQNLKYIELPTIWVNDEKSSTLNISRAIFSTIKELIILARSKKLLKDIYKSS